MACARQAHRSPASVLPALPRPSCARAAPAPDPTSGRLPSRGRSVSRRRPLSVMFSTAALITTRLLTCWGRGPGGGGVCCLARAETPRRSGMTGVQSGGLLCTSPHQVHQLGEDRQPRGGVRGGLQRADRGGVDPSSFGAQVKARRSRACRANVVGVHGAAPGTLLASQAEEARSRSCSCMLPGAWLSCVPRWQAARPPWAPASPQS